MRDVGAWNYVLLRLRPNDEIRLAIAVVARNLDGLACPIVSLLPDERDVHPSQVRDLLRVDRSSEDIETVTGLESIVSQRHEDFDSLTDVQRDALREAVAVFRSNRTAADLTGHILTVVYA